MVVKWTEIDMPWFEVDEFLELIIDKVSILDILDRWGVSYEACQSGDFTHRMKCPLPIHMDGGERTASFFVSEPTNKFYCFGCNSRSSVVDLVSLHDGRPFYESLKWLAKVSGIVDVGDEDLKHLVRKEKIDPEKTVYLHVFKTGVLIRNFVSMSKGKKEHNKWCKWADSKFSKLDGYLDRLEDNDWEIAKSYYDSTLNYIKSRT